ncbi:unnamed protein product [Diatraea saccharalis]|uniref:Carboxylic ester hydrolase n=1 Tax=Diatraea saccharalis TaxID=40085 RepID=A0A9P0G2Y5_9NEOP|nr:unnamed protein product [Diatraea saccharalis]
MLSLKWSNKWLVLWSLWAARLVRQPTPAVRVSGGWLRGTVAPAGTHVQYLGVPYATVPNRFQSPDPEVAWKGVFEAVDDNIRCIQSVRVGSSITMGREECLRLNIYTPIDISPNKYYPVMVYFHGGGFMSGSNSQALYGPTYLTDKDVILVTVNYRLNIQGFLCLGIKEAPGNAGLKDQVSALKWVQRNIKAFGGDVDNVTIFGESAGAVSVSYHVISPMSRGLFHKAIMQSGSPLASWALQHDPVYVASQKAKILGLKSTDPRELYDFLYRQSDADLITKIVPRDEGNTIISQLIFLPCVEEKFDGVEPFLTATPFSLLSKGNFTKVPMIIGLNSEEGLFFVNMEDNHFISRIDFNISLPKNLDLPTNDERIKVAREIESMYMEGKKVSSETFYNYSKFLGETFIEYPIYEEIDIVVQNNDKPVYSYLFNYDGWRNIPKRIHQRKEFKNLPGATHADDLFYMFSQQLIPSLFEYDMINKVTTMWTNFAKYGDPTPSISELLPVKWPPVVKEKDDQGMLYIDQKLSVTPLPRRQSLDIWKNIFSKYRRKHGTL